MPVRLCDIDCRVRSRVANQLAEHLTEIDALEKWRIKGKVSIPIGSTPLDLSHATINAASNAGVTVDELYIGVCQAGRFELVAELRPYLSKQVANAYGTPVQTRSEDVGFRYFIPYIEGERARENPAKYIRDTITNELSELRTMPLVGSLAYILKKDTAADFVRLLEVEPALAEYVHLTLSEAKVANVARVKDVRAACSRVREKFWTLTPFNGVFMSSEEEIRKLVRDHRYDLQPLVPESYEPNVQAVVNDPNIIIEWACKNPQNKRRFAEHLRDKYGVQLSFCNTDDDLYRLYTQRYAPTVQQQHVDLSPLERFYEAVCLSDMGISAETIAQMRTFFTEGEFDAAAVAAITETTLRESKIKLGPLTKLYKFIQDYKW
eukprot:TRINITY_DN1874_c0_g1_i2.p2 TRINITY_DN1874_c0_g1~~TRINITY_DN1874_c0_g1_i2.p2  ORF type:complete len:378 (+),score=80.87 TRINITY_DN1874_c0_g1_i2:162-1295(+)